MNERRQAILPLQNNIQVPDMDRYVTNVWEASCPRDLRAHPLSYFAIGESREHIVYVFPRQLRARTIPKRSPVRESIWFYSCSSQKHSHITPFFSCEAVEDRQAVISN